MEFEIKIPQSATDLRIKHYKALKNPDAFTDESDEGRIQFLCDFLNLKLHQVRLLKPEHVDKIFRYSAVAFAGMKIGSEPPKEIVLDGKTFERIDPKKVGIGWHIDMNEASKGNWLEKKPVHLACLFYYPKGYEYGALDSNDNLIHPIKDRLELFENNFMLQTFMESTAFFLGYYAKSKRKLIIQKLAQKQILKLLNKVRSLLGKKPLT